jgi:hydantoinase/carbamoylase family amidase
LRGLAEKFSWNVKRLWALMEDLASIGADDGGGVSREAFSPEDLQAREMIRRIMEAELGLQVHIDPWGNIIGRREGIDPQCPSIMTGSHLDTVRNGGRFDGAAGVVGAMEVIRALNEMGIQTIHPLEVAVFAAEEPNDFGVSTLGSRGMTGKLPPDDLKSCRNSKGEELLSAISRAGGNPDALHEAVRREGDILAFVELHIEQMDRLQKRGRDIGIVKGVTGIRRYRVEVTGEAGHGGTIPMEKRRDALAAAAWLISRVEALARRERGRAVATVGQLCVYPNSVNIIPSRVQLQVEIRSYNTSCMDRLESGIRDCVGKMEADRGVKATIEKIYSIEPLEFSPWVRGCLVRAARRCGCSVMELVSMAGHDAYHMASITEAGMIFVPSHSGASHCPQEWTDPAQLLKGVMVLFEALLDLDRKEGKSRGHGTARD